MIAPGPEVYVNLLLVTPEQIVATTWQHTLYVHTGARRHHRGLRGARPRRRAGTASRTPSLLVADADHVRITPLEGTRMSDADTLQVDTHLDPADLGTALRADARRGLTATPKDLPPKWFYDDRGSELFDEITRLPEYYPTRTERSILLAHADDIVAASGADTLVELGSGTSEKTRILLDAFHGARPPADVRAVRRVGGDAARRRRPGRGRVPGRRRPRRRRRLRAAPRARARPPGTARSRSSAGRSATSRPSPARASSPSLAATLRPGETLLLGTDLVKDEARLVRAYDDAAGVTAAFNKNVLHVLNRELGADLRSRRVRPRRPLERRPTSGSRCACAPATRCSVAVPALDLDVEFAAGEEMRTEISAKFRRDKVAGELAAAGFELAEWWTDPAGDFALSLARRVEEYEHAARRRRAPRRPSSTSTSRARSSRS